TISDGAGLMLGLKDLPKVVFGKDNSEFLRHSSKAEVAYIEKVSPQRKMRSMLLQNSKRQQASTLRVLNSLQKIRRSKLFPFWRQLRLRQARNRTHQKQNNNSNTFSHAKSPRTFDSIPSTKEHPNTDATDWTDQHRSKIS